MAGCIRMTPASTASRAAFWLYGLAFLGAHLAFMPLMVLLLPRRVEALAPQAAAEFLSWLLLTGGVVAGITHLLSGALSDRWFSKMGNRRGLISIGCVFLLCAYVGLAFANTRISLFAAVGFFQIALNLCFAPLGALLADHFPDEVKGRLAGLMNSALPASTLLVWPVSQLFPEDHAGAFIAVGVVAVSCIMPLLVFWNLETPEAKFVARVERPTAARAFFLPDFLIGWFSRLLIQIAAAFVFGFIYLYLSNVQQTDPEWTGVAVNEMLALLTVPTALLAIFATLIGGYWSDVKGVRRVPMLVSAAVLAGGLGLLAFAPVPALFILAFGMFQIGLTVFLAVDTAFVAQLIGNRQRRGTLLGIMNLANTLPAIIVPALALAAFKAEEVAGVLGNLFAVFAVTSLCAGVLLMFIRSVR